MPLWKRVTHTPIAAVILLVFTTHHRAFLLRSPADVVAASGLQRHRAVAELRQQAVAVICTAWLPEIARAPAPMEQPYTGRLVDWEEVAFHCGRRHLEQRRVCICF